MRASQEKIVRLLGIDDKPLSQYGGARNSRIQHTPSLKELLDSKRGGSPKRTGSKRGR